MSNAQYVESVLAEHFEPIHTQLDKHEVAAQLASMTMSSPVVGVKVDSIVGGAGSGKTTMAEAMVASIRQNGDNNADILSSDNYAKGDRHYRHIELKGAPATEKYDLALLRSHIGRIRTLQAGESLMVPVLDKETGIAASADEADYSYEVGPVDALIIEGDLPIEGSDFQIFMHIPDEKRLQNYVKRSLEYKSTLDPAQLTNDFNTWQRTTYLPYTLPILKTVDYVVASDAEGDNWEYTMYGRREA